MTAAYLDLLAAEQLLDEHVVVWVDNVSPIHGGLGQLGQLWPHQLWLEPSADSVSMHVCHACACMSRHDPTVMVCSTRAASRPC
jgi:hypothetical protein